MNATPPGPQLAHEIADLARRDGLVLFTGAGINGEAGLMWDALLANVLRHGLACALTAPADVKQPLALIRAGYDPYAQAGIARTLMGARRFVPILRSALYSKPECDFTALDQYCRSIATQDPACPPKDSPASSPFGYLASIARLCMRREIEAVVTLNFDTLLESAMQSIRLARQSSLTRWRRQVRLPVPVARQVEARHRAGRGERLEIHHVHGCLPPPGGLARLLDYPIVLTQQDFARTMQEPYSRETSLQLHYLRSHPCLFLGLSMSDWNILRLLQAADPPRPDPRGVWRWCCIGVSPEPLQAEIKARLLADYAVGYHAFIGADYAPLRRFIDQLCAELESHENHPCRDELRGLANHPDPDRDADSTRNAG